MQHLINIKTYAYGIQNQRIFKIQKLRRSKDLKSKYLQVLCLVEDQPSYQVIYQHVK